MAFVNFNSKEITAKIVYYGPGLGGKTSSLQYIYNNLPDENRGKMISLATDEDRTIYFDFLPLHLGKIQNFTVKVQLYTVPGQVRYNATRKLVLKGVDGIVFVADSQIHRKFSNIESYNNLEENLFAYQKDLKDVPHVIQYNKIDLPNIIKTEELNQLINKYGAPYYQTCAITGIGIMDSLKTISKLVFAELSKKGITSKSYLIERAATSSEEEVKEVEQEKETPFMAEETIDEPHEIEVAESEIEELSSEDIEVVEDDLSTIEPHYGEYPDKREIETRKEEELFQEREMIEDRTKLEDKESQERDLSQLREIEYSPEYFAVNLNETEEREEEEPKELNIEKISEEAPFEELEDLTPFVQLDSGIESNKQEEIAFSEFIEHEIKEEKSDIKEEKVEESIFEKEEESDVKIENADIIEIMEHPHIDEQSQISMEEENPSEEKELEFEQILDNKLTESFTLQSETMESQSEQLVEELSAEEIYMESNDSKEQVQKIISEVQEKIIPENQQGVSVTELKSEQFNDTQLRDEKIDETKYKEEEKEGVTPAPLEEKIISESILQKYNVFSYSIITENVSLKENILALENSLVDNHQVDVYKYAEQIFNAIIEELENKIDISEARSLLEKLLIIGIQVHDYRLFITTMRNLKNGIQENNDKLYFLHNFLANLIYKVKHL